MSLKNLNDTIGNRTRDLPVCSATARPAVLKDTIKMLSVYEF